MIVSVFSILNHVGANASLIFDGNSFVVNSKGISTYKLATFKEDFMVIDTERLPVKYQRGVRSHVIE